MVGNLVFMAQENAAVAAILLLDEVTLEKKKEH